MICQFGANGRGVARVGGCEHLLPASRTARGKCADLVFSAFLRALGEVLEKYGIAPLACHDVCLSREGREGGGKKRLMASVKPWGLVRSLTNAYPHIGNNYKAEGPSLPYPQQLIYAAGLKVGGGTSGLVTLDIMERNGYKRYLLRR